VHGEAVTGPLFLLAALLALAATVMPFGAALALKVSLD
jgi:ABC-type transport system involved in cytochrome c biogenesis permease component